MSIRFIHCADLHLDSPLRGLERYDGAPAQEMREATRRAFVNVVDLAIDREVDFVLIAGDVFDGDWQDFNTGLFFANQLRRLADSSVRVFIVRGNHDALSKISKAVTLPKNTHVFRAGKPDTIVDETLGVAIHGQSFASGVVTDDLASQYPEPRRGLLNIGLLHTALAGREGHETYAPTTAERLIDKGYDYWALGHVHNREVVRETPWIVFPGNTQGRHARELGAKGCMLVEGSADEGIVSVEFVATDVARWQHLEVDATDMTSVDDLQETVQQSVRAAVTKAGDRLLALRLTVHLRRWQHFGIRRCAEGAGTDRLRLLQGQQLTGQRLHQAWRTRFPSPSGRIAAQRCARGPDPGELHRPVLGCSRATGAITDGGHGRHEPGRHDRAGEEPRRNPSSRL